ncbi:hypothetical protein L1049_007344 [Liquidambar formosana]|uniref:Uncharacterized protein n=1 Tax=Liquidambar formosana TaxID=63359 RepID=A0AAP0R503_LIQFO
MSILVLFGFLILCQHVGFPNEWRRFGLDAHELGGEEIPFPFKHFDNAFAPSPKAGSSTPPSTSGSTPEGVCSAESVDDFAEPKGMIFDSSLTIVETPPLPEEKDDEKSCPKEDASHDKTLDLIARRLSVSPITKEFFNSLKVQQKFIERLKELSKKERRYEDDLEIADFVYLLKLLSPSNPVLETFSKKAGKGAMLLLEGDRLLTAGRDLLQSAIIDISTSTE